MNRRIAAGLALATMTVGLIGVTPPVAVAKSAVYNVQLDAPHPGGEPWDFLRMFPAKLKVHQGDVVNFAWAGTDAPHTATVVPDADANAWRADNQGSGDPYELFVPDTNFGGDDGDIILNPADAFPSDPTCGAPGDACVFDGSGVVNSGFLFSDPAAEPAFRVRMSAPVGSYSFLCLVHRGMQIPVQIVSTHGIASPATVDERIANQVANATAVDGPIADAQAQTVGSAPLSTGATKWLVSAGGFSNGVSAEEFPDTPISVSVGDKIQVSGNFEIHTATFPESSVATVPLIFTVCEQPGADSPATSPFDCADPSQFQIVLNPQAAFPTSDNRLVNPARFVNSGIVATPGSFVFRANHAGTYTFVCLVHGPEMQGTIVVQPAV